MTTAIPFLGTYVREIKTCAQKNLVHNVHSSIIPNREKVETTQNAHQLTNG